MLTNHSVIYSTGLRGKLSLNMWDIWSWNYLAYILRKLHVTWGGHMCHRSLSGASTTLSTPWIKRGMENWIQAPALTSSGTQNFHGKLIFDRMSFEDGSGYAWSSLSVFCEARCIRLLRTGCSFVIVNITKSEARPVKSPNPSSCSFG